ncbi:hypothetical protein [Streptomyces sp. cmx-4-9]|uniref:hypothetical protein n=1 Tax=Streptomyces sp. cmx-4-9 TaxID=2790941 RepID=UPI003981898B
MPDLHGWISQQIAEVEERARACPPTTAIVEGESGDYTPIEVRTDAGQGHAVGLLVAVSVVLRRCAADRKILARHSVDPTSTNSRLWATACSGCGSEGDCDDPVTENINDCPELLDPAWAHGMSAAIIATLDRPQPPEWKPTPQPPEWKPTPEPPMRTADVPAALRGPNWNPRR